jgi:fumarate hydratase class I
VLAFDDLGMEAIHEFTLQDSQMTVAVDMKGRSVFLLRVEPSA